MESEKSSECPGFEGRGVNKRHTGFSGGETILCGAVMEDTCHCAFVKTHRTTQPEV